MLVFLLILSLNAEPPARFSADSYIKKDKTILLEGDVEVLKGPSSIKANEIDFSTEDQTFKARGDVIYSTTGLKIKGKEINAGFDTDEGHIQEGSIESGSTKLEGTDIKRLSKDEFHIKEGRYTNCRNDPPDWRIYGNNIDVTLEEYAHLNNVVVETFGLPFFYIPYAILPIKSQRQTGLLAPEAGFGVDGFVYKQSFFWAISRSHDMSLDLGYYGKRGFSQGVEIRNIFSKDSRSNLYFFHIKDGMFSQRLVDKNIAEIRKHRSALKLDQVIKLKHDIYMKNHIQYVSDNAITRDFPKVIPGRADAATENKISFSKITNSVSYSMDFVYYQNLINENPIANNNEQLQRFPEIRITMPDNKIGPFFFGTEFSYLNIYRAASAFDDFNNNNSYDDNEFIRKGQRLDFYPKISAPITTRYINLIPELGVRYNYYNFPIGIKDAHKLYTEFKLKLNTEISRIYTRSNNDKVKHLIEPFVTYHITPSINKTTHPFFNANYNGITSPMFDPIDKVERTHQLIYGLSNRLITKSTTVIEKELGNCTSCSDNFLSLRESFEDQVEDIEVITSSISTITKPFEWNIYQSYNLKEGIDRPLSNLYSDMWLRFSWFNLFTSNFFDVYNKNIGTNSSLTLSDSKKFIRLGYYYDKTRDRDANQIRFRTGFKLWQIGTTVGFIYNHKLEGSVKDKIGDKYLRLIYFPKSSCWTAEFEARSPYDKPGYTFMFSFNFLFVDKQADWF